MIKKTKNYSMFKLREDNRAEGVRPSHVKVLVESIKKKNLLDMCPILVNSDFEVINGQHRLKAAEELGVDIYYEQDDRLEGKDIILMNIGKAWMNTDILNYYVKNGYKEYQKLDAFLKENRLTLKVALAVLMGGGHSELFKFRHGDYIFDEGHFGCDVNLCWHTIDTIKKFNGASPYTHTARFWRPLVKLMRHRDFDKDKWFENLRKNIDKFFPRANSQGYTKLIQDVFNWHNQNKIDIMGEDEYEIRMRERNEA